MFYCYHHSYLVYAGLVFVSLSQPYMQHQYGKDWARKAPIRLCDRVLYGVLNKAGQEVILLSQVSLTVTVQLFLMENKAEILPGRRVVREQCGSE